MNPSRPLIAGLTALCLALPLDAALAQEDAAKDAAELVNAAAEAAAEAATESAAEAVAAEDVAADEQGEMLACGDEVQADWIGNSREAFDLPNSQEPFQERLTGQESRMRAFHLNSPQSLRLEARSNNNGDPSLRLLNAEGAEIEANDDLPRTLNAGIEADLPEGDYCLVLNDLSENMDVTLQLGRQDQPALIESAELQCGPQTPAEMLAQGPLEAALAKGAVTSQGSAERNRYLRFDLAAPTSLTLSAKGGGQIDAYLALFDENGQQIAANDDADGRDPRMDFVPDLAAGSYCLGVGAMSQGQGMISVSAQHLDVAEHLRRAYARGELPPADDSYPVKPLSFKDNSSEVILQGSAATWFSFELPDRAVVDIHTLGSVTGADTRLVLFDGKGQLVEDNDDGENSRDARIGPTVLRGGKYHLALMDVSVQGQQGAPLRPVVIMAEKFIRAE